MIGDQNDGAGRVRAQLPYGWFGQGSNPVVDALLQGYGWAISTAYGFLAYARTQSRIRTATGGWLDLISADFFGRRLTRKFNQSDDAFRARILAALFRQRVTREGVRQAVVALTGISPFIFEPRRPQDTGGYGVACGYGAAGGYGSVVLPGQAFVIAQRPTGEGVAVVTGYGQPAGGYGVGAAEYVTLSQQQDAVQDADIFAAVNDARPAGAIVWVNVGGKRITSQAAAQPGVLDFSDPNQSGLLAAL